MAHTTQLQVSFSADAATEWGFKFYVLPERSLLSDAESLAVSSFEFAECLIDWMLSLGPAWAKDFYVVEVFDAIVNRLLRKSSPLNTRRHLLLAVYLIRYLGRQTQQHTPKEI